MPEIFVELIPDFTKLEAALDSLTKSGVITKDFSEAFKKASASAVTAASNQFQKLSTGIQNAGKSAAAGLAKGVEQGMKPLTENIKEQGKSVGNTTEKFTSLRETIRNNIQQMAIMRAEGRDNTEQYEKLVAQTGKYRDALQDVTKMVNIAASDTRLLDTMITTAQGITAAFSISAGAAQLFGKKSEELTEIMMQLSGVMLIANGLQQLQSLTLRESALVRAVVNAQTAISVTLTKLEAKAREQATGATIAQTIAMRVLNTVMKSNPALWVVAGIMALVGAFAIFSSSTRKAKKEAEDFTAALKAQREETDRSAKRLSDTQEEVIKNMEAEGKTEVQIAEKRASFAQEQVDNETRHKNAIIASIEAEQKNIDSLKAHVQEQKDVAKATKNYNAVIDEHTKEISAAKKKQDEYGKSLKESEDKLGGFSRSLRIANADVKIARQSADKDAAKAAEDAAKQAEERQQQIAGLSAKDRLRALETVKTRLETELLLTEKNTKQELELKAQIAVQEKRIKVEQINQAADAEIAAAKKVGLPITHIIEQRNAEIEKANTDMYSAIDEITTSFYQSDTKKAIQSRIDLTTAELNQMTLSATEKEQLTTKLLNDQRLLELSAEGVTKEKEKEINSRYDKEIAEQRLTIREAAFKREQTANERRRRSEREADEAIIADETKPAEERIAAIDRETQAKSDAISKEIDFRETAVQQQLGDQQELNDEIEQLIDDQTKLYEDAERKKTEIVKKEAEERIKTFQDEFSKYADLALQGLQAFSELGKSFSAQQTASFDAQMQDLQNLHDANALTDKQLADRQKQLEAARKKAARENAIMEKQMALFTATIQGSAAIIKALPPTSPAFFVTVAIVAAQITAIANKPIPKFATGTKRAPKGLVEIGERGTELVKMKEGYYVAEYPQVIWMKGGERIYSAKETERIIMQQTPVSHPELVNYVQPPAQKGEEINYNKLSKAISDEIAKHPRTIITLDENGFTNHVIEQGTRTRYRNKRYTFGR